jgi:outer membrane lipoprotein LolB
MLMAVLAACSAAPRRADTVATPSSHERARVLAGRPVWDLDAKLGVSNHGQSGSGTLEWRQDGDAFRFSVRAPVTGKTWVLHGDAGGEAVLEGLHPQPVAGSDAAGLLARELHWRVPVAEMRYWVLALAAPGTPARIRYRADGLPARIIQSGWTIDYPEYDTGDPALPRRIYAQRGDARVRLAIRRWRWR